MSLGGRFCGTSDPPLDEAGRREAAVLRRQLSGSVHGRVWVSPLLRARQTARAAGLDATVDDRLREQDFGAWEGKTWESLSAIERTQFLAFDCFRPPGGESSAELQGRLLDFVDDLEPGSHLVVTHGGPLRVVLRSLGQDRLIENGGTLAVQVSDAPGSDFRVVERVRPRRGDDPA